MECKCGCQCDPKRWIVTSLAVAILYAALDFFFHHVCLLKIYTETADLWRSVDQIKALMPYAYIGYLIFGFVFTCIYSHGHEEGKKRLLQGIRYGFAIGVLVWGTGLLICYPFVPYPGRLLVDWFIVGMVEYIILGIVTALLYRTKPAAAA